MRYLKDQNVYDASVSRVSYLFDEFENIICSISGGKDSTVVFHLCLEEAKRRNRLPLNVMWIDQEAEWQGTVDICRQIMERDDVKPYWFQMPIVISNNASLFERFAHCWDEDQKDNWIHPKHELSIKENKYNTSRFKKLFNNILMVEFPNQKTALIGGLRGEESPRRMAALTQKLAYKDITWGKKVDQNHFIFYPIYDWRVSDVWKCIAEKKLPYNRVYDEMYRLGLPMYRMRISNVHHETSVHALEYMQEIEPHTWNRVVKRICGANTVKHLQNSSISCPMELPYMFKDWEEYAVYLADNLIKDEKNRRWISEQMERDRFVYLNGNESIKKKYCRVIINTILNADWDFTKIRNFKSEPQVFTYENFRRRKWDRMKNCDHLLEIFTKEEKRAYKKEKEIWKKSKKQ